jgi:hypothetical protein
MWVDVKWYVCHIGVRHELETKARQGKSTILTYQTGVPIVCNAMNDEICVNSGTYRGCTKTCPADVAQCDPSPSRVVNYCIDAEEYYSVGSLVSEHTSMMASANSKILACGKEVLCW